MIDSRRVLPLLFMCLLAGGAVGQDEVYLKVTAPGLQRLIIAVPPMATTAGVDGAAAASFTTALRDDLNMTAVLGLLPDDIARLVEIDAKNPVLTRQRGRAVGAQFILDGSLMAAGNQLTVEIKLVDLTSGEVALARRLQAANQLAATMAHTLANELVRLFTGRPGPFLSRIAFISDRTGHKEVWIMRWDGGEPQQLTSHRSIASAPTWSGDGTWLAFTSFLHTAPELLVLKPSQGYLKTLSTLPGVNSSASFSPDGRTVAFAAAAGGATEIWVVPVASGAPERRTNLNSISTQPAWSPNGRQIVFTSTAAGSPQLYVMDAEGTNMRRVTLDDEFADEAAWAPDGVRLAYTTKVDGRFQIAILDLRGGPRSIVGGPGSNESPCFSPDGTMLAFSSNRTGRRQIFITDPLGQPRQITRDGSNQQPSWVAQMQ